MPAARRVFLLILALLILLLLFAVPTVSLAQETAPPPPLADAAREFARRIASALTPRAEIQFELRNLSSMYAPEVVFVQRHLESYLYSAGFWIVPEGRKAPLQIRTTISENSAGYLWIAEVPRGDSMTVLMHTAPRPLLVDVLPVIATVSVAKQLIWQQPEPMLDFWLTANDPGDFSTLFVLDTYKLSSYEREDGGWKLRRAIPIAHEKPWPRDFRGRLHVWREEYSVSLPETSCHGRAQAQLTMKCEHGSWWWNLESGDDYFVLAPFVADRNYFEDKQHGGFYFGEALLPAPAIARHLRTGTDGRARLYHEGKDPVALFPDWGSDIQGVDTECGSRVQVLVTRSGDWTLSDAIQAYEIVGIEAVPVSSPVEFPGPILALWDNHAVVRNLKTGRYEAYRLTISCGK